MKFFAAIKSFDPRRIYEDKKSFVCAISMLRVCTVYNSEVEGQARGSASGSGIAEVNFKKFGVLATNDHSLFYVYTLNLVIC